MLHLDTISSSSEQARVGPMAPKWAADDIETAMLQMAEDTFMKLNRRRRGKGGAVSPRALSPCGFPQEKVLLPNTSQFLPKEPIPPPLIPKPQSNNGQADCLPD